MSTAHPVRFLHSSHPLGASAPFLAAVLLAAGARAQYVPHSPQLVAPSTKTAVATPTDFPDASGRFEHSGVSTHQYAPTWPPWTFQPLAYVGDGVPRGSGIAHNNSPLLSESAQAPEGRRVAFVHGIGAATCTYTFTPGTWRLRFLAAQRVQSGVPDGQAIRVEVGGTEVFSQEIADEVYKEYLTEPFRVTVTGSMTVAFRGLTAAGDSIGLIDRVLLDRVLPWNDPATWDAGAVPGGNDDVFLPQFTAVAMDGACVAGTVQTEGLLMADDVDGSLTARWVLVHQAGARFRVGTEQQPFAYDFEVRLTGEDPSENVLNHIGTKFLAAMDGGEVDMHGQPKKSWTRLGSTGFDTTAPSVITVDDWTGWQVGDEILVVYTGWMGPGVQAYNASYATRSRRCVITDIDAGTGELTLDTTLTSADHCTAPTQTYPANAQPGQKTWDLDQRAEVGMLSHNVRVVSILAPGSTFGGHVMLMGHSNGEHGRGRFSNVELRNLGQEQRLARYPMHWHMQVDNGAGQYMRNCSVNQSFNRAITIHGSHFVTVEDNVCFDVMGHAVFFEDGVEQHNQVHRNLVVFTRRPYQGKQLLIHDNELDVPQNRTPAAFWITHPDNHFTGNVAAETVGTGYWFALHNQPTGKSAELEWAATFGGIDATQGTLGTFDDNVAHGCKSGFDVNDTLRDAPFGQPPHLSPEDPLDDFIWTNRSWDPPTQKVLNRFVAYGCPLGIYSGLGTGNAYTDLVVFRDCVLADNGGSIQLASAFIVEDSLIVHDSGNGILGTGTAPLWQGHAQVVYDGPAQMYDCHLVGFDGPGGAGMFYDNFGAARRHTNHRISGLTYEGGSTPVVSFEHYPSVQHPQSGVWGVAIEDVDGSLTDGVLPGYTLITNHPMMHVTDGGSGTPDVPVTYGQNSWLSPFKFGHLQVHHYFNNQYKTTTQLPTTGFTRKPYLGWAGASYDSAGDPPPGPQIRQTPAIVRRDGEPSPSFVYTVELRDTTAAQTQVSINRVDIVMDDLDVGDETLMELTFAPDPSWSPTVYLNDGALYPPPAQNQLSPGITAGQTGYTLGNGTVTLQMVNTQRAHRVTFLW